MLTPDEFYKMLLVRLVLAVLVVDANFTSKTAHHDVVSVRDSRVA